MTKTLDIMDILKILPHRYPFLLVDRIEELKAGESAIGIKNVSMNEPQFVGHFHEHPIMPGVLIIESCAQTAAAIVMSQFGDSNEGKLVYFMGIESAKFRKPVRPGDQMKIYAHKVQSRKNVWRFKADVKVDDVLVAEAEFTAMIVE